MSFAYDVHYTQRKKSIAVKIEAGRVVVLAPKHCGVQQIEQLLQDKANWIDRKLQQAAQQRQDVANKVFEQGGTFSYLGDSYQLNLIASSAQHIVLHGGTMHVHLPNPHPFQVAKVLYQWYQTQAKHLLPSKTAEIASLLGKSYNKIKFGRFKRQWGSCNTRAEIGYNWLLVQAPESVIDYVVVHEVCHLEHMNHSKAFWALVASLCPDYKVQRQWLKQNAHRLQLPA